MKNNPGQGRKPKPTHLKLLEGEVNKKRINFNEPKPRPKAPKCPSWLSREAKKEWRRLAPELERLNLLTKNDLAMFASYCAAFGKLAWAERLELGMDARRIPSSDSNVIARKNPCGKNKIVLTAHIDAYEDSPGASDNASGTVVLMLLAELLVQGRTGELWSG